ncbi:hypothetical protein FUA23_05525 [Neolewinella aurantiaca]|uniref:DUF481 domain-containing protein n=1 Tax=Neolewinella aurantiaca TaxID=2602767 RepID=A0A5C7FIX6_9BACT|nr:hypothetical protein [Neolewinella aurantiaca]TXF90558.1 hypothetical protein FUA23_05525 [Neolewinella aurantiaca]
MRALLLLLLLSFLPALNLQAQKRNTDLVVFADGTTKEGTVRKSGVSGYGRAIRFAERGVEDEQQLSPTSVSEFTLAGNGRTYRSVTAEIPDPGQRGKPVLQQRFGEVLIDGEIQLIRVNLDGNEYDAKALGTENYFYLLRQDDIELVLELTTIVIYERLHANPSRFRNKLKFFVRSCDDVIEQARRADFNDASIMRVLRNYSECEHLQQVEINEGRIPSRINYRHSIIASNLVMRDMNYDTDQFSLGISYEIEAAASQRMKWFGMLFSLGYVYNSFRWEEQFNVAQSMVKGNVSLAFSPVHKEDFTVQLTAGLSNYNAFDSSFNSFFSNNYFLLSTGLRVRHKNVVAHLSYEHTPNQIKEQPGNILVMGLGYKLPF